MLDEAIKLAEEYLREGDIKDPKVLKERAEVASGRAFKLLQNQYLDPKKHEAGRRTGAIGAFAISIAEDRIKNELA